MALAFILDNLQCKYCKLEGVFFFIEKHHGHFSSLKAILGDKMIPASSYVYAVFRVDVVVSLHVCIPILVLCLQSNLPWTRSRKFIADGSFCILAWMEK